MAKKQDETRKQLTISPPNFETAVFRIRGTSPYVQNKFSVKALAAMKGKQAAGSVAGKGAKKEPKDFEQCYQDAMHKFPDGTPGLPAPAFRNAMVSACRVVGFKMTLGKLSVFTEADGFDKDDGTPLIKFVKGKPHYHEGAVRIQMTTDIRARAMWDAGWEADVRIRFDADQFTAADVANLMMRVGMQVGIGEGRPDSRSSCGMGWGMFELVQDKEKTRGK